MCIFLYSKLTDSLEYILISDMEKKHLVVLFYIFQRTSMLMSLDGRLIYTLAQVNKCHFFHSSSPIFDVVFLREISD